MLMLHLMSCNINISADCGMEYLSVICKLKLKLRKFKPAKKNYYNRHQADLICKCILLADVYCLSGEQIQEPRSGQEFNDRKLRETLVISANSNTSKEEKQDRV